MFDIGARLGLKKRRNLVMEASPDDYGAIADLHAASFPRGWSKVEITQLAEQSGSQLLVVRRVGDPKQTICGFNLYRSVAGEAEILSIAVSSKFRRSGLAEKMMREALLRLHADRTESLFLEVDSTNIAAVHLYQKLGFEAVGARPGYYKKSMENSDTPRATALIMRIDLVPPVSAG